MCIDVVDILGSHAGVRDRRPHCRGSALALGIGSGDMPGITCCSVTEHFSINACAAALGMLQLFKHQQAGTFTEHKPIPIGIEWPTCRRRILVPCRQCLHVLERSQAHVSDCCFGTARDDHVGFP